MEALVAHDGSLLFFCDYWEAEEYCSRRPDRPPRSGPIPIDGRAASCVYCSACGKRAAPGWGCHDCLVVICPASDWHRTAVASEVAQIYMQRHQPMPVPWQEAEALSQADPALTGEEIVDLLDRDAAQAWRANR